MMYPPPYFGYPNYKRPYNYKSPYINNGQYKNSETSGTPKILEDKEQKNNKDIEEKEEYINFFGLKLEFDDILIIALIYFLYKEDVKDTYLFVALILLLLS